MRPDRLAIIWIGGFVLAAIIYAIGPDRFVDACLNFVQTIDDAVRAIAQMLGAEAFGVVRALAIAFYIVFAVLCFMASSRRLGGISTLVVVTVVNLALVWRPYSAPAPLSQWTIALILILVGATTITQRLMAAPQRPPFPPQAFPPGRP